MMKKLFFSIGMVLTITALAGAQNLPTKPDPGKCYVKCITKDVFTEVSETVEVHTAYQTLEVIPATYKTVEERVLVKEATKRYTNVPAVYETVDVSYTTGGGAEKFTVIPAQFGSRIQSYKAYPETSGWEYKQLKDCQSINKEDCVAACYVESPAQFQVVRYRNAWTTPSGPKFNHKKLGSRCVREEF